MKVLLSVLMAVGLYGCATQQKIEWIHATKTANDLITDEAKCSAASMMMPRTTQLSAMQYQMDQQVYINTCIKAEGWRAK